MATGVPSVLRENTPKRSRAESVAHLYTTEHDAECTAHGLQRAAALTTGVSLEQARELIAAGAKWVGPPLCQRA